MELFGSDKMLQGTSSLRPHLNSTPGTGKSGKLRMRRATSCRSGSAMVATARVRGRRGGLGGSAPARVGGASGPSGTWWGGADCGGGAFGPSTRPVGRGNGRGAEPGSAGSTAYLRFSDDIDFGTRPHFFILNRCDRAPDTVAPGRRASRE